MNVWVLLVVFAVPVAAGTGLGLVIYVQDRRRLTRAFAQGRAENVTRLPMHVEPWPDIA